MAISQSLLRRVEVAFKNADPSVFKEGSPFSRVMEEWFSDSDNSKNFPRLKSSESQKRRSLGRTGLRLFVKKQLRDLRKGLYQKILRKITAGLSTDVLDSCNAKLLNKWLKRMHSTTLPCRNFLKKWACLGFLECQLAKTH